MTGLAISRYGMHTEMFTPLAAPITLIQMAGANTESKNMPLLVEYYLTQTGDS